MAALSAERLPERAVDEAGWESFYRDYKKPGYITGFEIGHKLGGGVFGIVYKARKESIGKAYAIKFLKVDDPNVKTQVVREIEQVSLFAQVDHPNLVSIEDMGLVDGIPYIVMGYAGDMTLRTRLDDGIPDEEEALRVFVQVCRGVQALHDHSLIHFDLKPANIFLKGDIARVGDYGLSKLVCESRMSLSFGRGTPYYMAPEMLQRRGDHRSDLYSLGVILYECLAGKVPFEGASEWEVLKGHEERAVSYPATVSGHYRVVLERLLAKDPDERYQSVGELLTALRSPGRLGESIVLEYGARLGGKATPMAATPVEAAPQRERPTVAGEGTGVVGGLVGGVLRVLVVALLVPARVLGIGLGRGLQLGVAVPIAILHFVGKLSLIALGGIMLLLFAVAIFGLFAG